MATRRVKVALTVDTTQFFAEMKRVEQAMLQFRNGLARAPRLARAARAARRALDTAGDRHIERIIRDCIDKRQTADQMRVRLLVASDAAQVIDGKWWS